MGCCFSKTKETTRLEEPILTVDEIYKPETPIFSTEEYHKTVETAKNLINKYNPNINYSDNGGTLRRKFRGKPSIPLIFNKSHL